MSSNPPQKLFIFGAPHPLSPSQKPMNFPLAGLIWDDTYSRRHARCPGMPGDDDVGNRISQRFHQALQHTLLSLLKNFVFWIWNLGRVFSHLFVSQMEKKNSQLQWWTKWWCFTWFLLKWLQSFNNFHCKYFLIDCQQDWMDVNDLENYIILTCDVNICM